MKKVGIVGCGGVARAHAEGYLATGKAELVAFHDTAAQRAEVFAREHGGTAYPSLETMLSSAELDAVSVCTPPSSHEEVTCKALAAGVSVCCEKPLAHSVESAKRMCACAEKAGALLVTAFKFRFFPNVLWAKQMIEHRRLGTIVAARNTFADIIDVSGSWFSRKDVAGGGVMMDNGVHGVDLLRFLFGEPRGVFAVAATRGRPLEVEDSCRILLDMVSNIWASVDLSWATPQPRNFLEVQGTEGIVELWPEGGAFTSASGEREVFDPPEDPVAGNPFAAQLDWFLDCLNGDRRPRSTASDGLRALQIIEAAYRCASQPPWITIPTTDSKGHSAQA